MAASLAARALSGRELHRGPSASASARYFTNLDRPVFALVNLPGDGQGRAVRALLALSGHAAAPVPGGVRRGSPARRPEHGGRGGPARRPALRADLPRLRRRLGGAARRRPRGLRVGLERADQGAPAPAAGRLPRAVDPLHRLRRTDAGPTRRLPLLPRRDARAGLPACDGRAVRDLLPRAAPGVRLGRDRVPPRRRRAGGGPRARDQGQGARPAARPAAGELAVAHGHLRHRPDLRAADPPPAGPPAARGARVRPHDPRGAAGGDPELPDPGRAPGPRRAMDRASSRPGRGPAPAGRSGSGWGPRTARPGRRSRCCEPTETRTTCWPRCCSRAARSPRRTSAAPSPRSTTTPAPRCWPI